MKKFPTPNEVATARTSNQERIDILTERCQQAVMNYAGHDPVVAPVDEYFDCITAVKAILDEAGWNATEINIDEPGPCGDQARLHLSITAKQTTGNPTIATTEPPRTKPTVQPPFPGSAQPAQTTAGTQTAIAAPVPATNVAPASNLAANVTPAVATPKQPASRTFKVSDVQVGKKALETVTPKFVLEKMLLGPVEACASAATRVIDPLGFHVLFEAAHQAFQQHYPLVFGPDDIWLTIAQGFARHVSLNPEQYRACFVSHAGKELIEIERNNFVLGSPNNDWQDAFAEFSTAIGERIGERNHKLLVANFSTTGPIERAASEVVLMDCVQSYFRYKTNTMCGIPEVTLKGTAEDWQTVIDKTRSLAAFGGLEWWLDYLYPILEQFHQVASGEAPNLSIWENLYKGKYESGGFTAKGWLLRLVPYVRYWDNQFHKNPILTGGRREDGNGVGTACLPSSLSVVPFIWNYMGTEYQYQFIAGHTGIEQNPTTLALEPRMGWAVRPAPVEAKEQD